MPSAVKRRRTNAQLAQIDDAIIDVLTEENPATVRSVFYRVTSRGLIEKTEAGYRTIGRQLLKLRRAGRIPYAWVSDGTRYVLRNADAYTGAGDALELLAARYHRRFWDTQPVVVQLYSEKDALRGVVAPITRRWDVELGVLRGYPSETFVFNVAAALDPNRRTYMYQLGDHDPSGVDAWRSFAEKVRTFNPTADVVFDRLAVTPAQITEYNLLTRPTKKTDTRAPGFAGESVEVDAIPPSTLRSIVEDAILQHVDWDAYEVEAEREKSEKELLRQFARQITTGGTL